MGDCLKTSEPSRYITNTKVNSAFHPLWVSTSSTALSSWDYGGVHSPASDSK